MKLEVLERILLLNLLPKEGDFITLKVIRDLQNALSFSEKEIKDLVLETKEGRVTWKPDKAVEKEIEIGEKATDVIVGALKKLNDDKKLTQEFFSIYEKFIKP